MANQVTTEPEKPGAFHTFQSTFTPSRRPRPPQPESLVEDGGRSRIPLKAGKLQRTGSKGGLRGMFTRNKLERDTMPGVLEEPVDERRPSEVKSIAAQSFRSIPARSLRRDDLAKDSARPTPVTPAKSIPKPSRMNLRPRTAKDKENKQLSKPSPKPVKPNPKSAPPQPTIAWVPPPLFQAYPQAIKYAQLSASILSADSIIRISNHKLDNNLKDGVAQNRKNIPGQDQATTKKIAKARSKHRRQMSGSISKADWIQKIYVLVTSGYLLQYSGEGPFDRLPEKVLQLGKDSVAFASDVIPGKHWVLQISQSMDAEGIPTADSRSLLSRLTFRGAEYRRTATSFLLVLNSAEEMDSWIAIVRREIESLGGKKPLAETGKQKPDDKTVQLKARPSHGHLVPRDPDQFSNPSTPVSPMGTSFGSPRWKVEDDSQGQTEEPTRAVLPPLLSARLLADHLSTPTYLMSHDARQGENPRENDNRLSYMSSGQRTLVTSQGSSATSSPTRESMSTCDELPSRTSNEDIQPTPTARTLNERRRSMQAMQIPTLGALPKNYRHSTFGVPNRSPRNYSFPKPNFSGLVSSSKRYPTIQEPPPLPAVDSPTSSKAMFKGKRNDPPPALNVSRPRSVENGALSPKSLPLVFTPTESSFRKLEQTRPSIINITNRLSNPPTPVDAVGPERRSSLMPSALEEHPSLHRNPSMIALQAATSAFIEAPSRPPPLPPAALEVPLPLSPLYPDYGMPELEAAIHAAQDTAHIRLPGRRTSDSKSKLRRPISMQNAGSHFSPTDSHPPLPKPTKSPHLSPTRQYFPSLLKEPSTHAATQRLKPNTAPGLANRRSMPMLVNGPPPMPPPNYALPPLPPGTSPRSARASRESARPSI
jgi:hypothetical protein